ncbi:MAG: DNA polymerase III subunit delta [Myxococcales bacterium]
MHAHEVTSAAEQGRVPDVVVLAGAEGFFVDRAVTALRAAAVERGMESFNEEIFHGKGLPAARVLDAARTLPMMASRRFVLVRGVDGMAAAELDRLVDYLEAPSESTCLVLTADKLDGRTRFARRAKKLGKVADAAPLKPSELRSFVASETKRRGLSMSRDAAAALVDAVGNDLPAIDDALERLSLYVGEGGQIDLAAVETCVAKVRVESIWALVDAVGMRDRRTAIRAAASLLADREPPLRILAMLARQLRMVGRMQTGLAEGLPPPEAAKQAGAPPFKARDLATAARRFRPEDLRRAFAVIAETDLALKGSRQPPDVVLEGAVLALTR